VGQGASARELHRQLWKAKIVTMLLDQLGEPHAAMAVAASASDFKVVEPTNQGAKRATRG
jgi:hypothetical protein